MRGIALLLATFAAAVAGGDEATVALRVENFVVPPATGPVMHVVVQNRGPGVWRGEVEVQPPEGWRINPPARTISLWSQETKHLAFVIEKGVNLDTNSYPIRVVARSGDQRVVRQRDVVCLSAPYFRPKIDGRASEWNDAIPVAFTCKGKRTVVRTYWNRDAFAVLIEVEEDALVGYRKRPDFDAVQLAVSPREAVTSTKASGRAERYEFLLVASASMWSGDKCFQLAKPGLRLPVTQEPRALAPLRAKDVKVAVRRRGGVTCYECAIPFARMPEIRPAEGREFCFSVLVHDPDGTGVRDWGEVAGLWPWQRSRLAWSLWQGAVWGTAAPFDNKIECGFCSSKH